MTVSLGNLRQRILYHGVNPTFQCQNFLKSTEQICSCIACSSTNVYSTVIGPQTDTITVLYAVLSPLLQTSQHNPCQHDGQARPLSRRLAPEITEWRRYRREQGKDCLLVTDKLRLQTDVDRLANKANFIPTYNIRQRKKVLANVPDSLNDISKSSQ